MRLWLQIMLLPSHGVGPLYLLVPVQLWVMPEDAVVAECTPAITSKVFFDALLVGHTLFQTEDVLVVTALVESCHALGIRVGDAAQQLEIDVSSSVTPQQRLAYMEQDQVGRCGGRANEVSLVTVLCLGVG